MEAFNPDLKKTFILASVTGVIASLVNSVLRAYVFPLFGIAYQSEPFLYGLIGLVVGFVSIFIISYLIKRKLSTLSFALYCALCGAILLPILRLILLPLLGFNPLFSPMFYAVGGAIVMFISAYSVRIAKVMDEEGN